MNKNKIINDPVYGFVSIPTGLVFDLVQHPYFQRLRYIKQVSMTHLVYPGALHTRFQHAIGSMHLMAMALETLRSKGVFISDTEEEAVLSAILLHDIGHGPFSHSLEHSLIEGVSHELLSSLLMDRINQDLDGRLSLAITIFNNKYERKFLHQLVSSQLDVDRMDYLNRDSFFTGVSEGVISFDRIIKMLNVVADEIVVDYKGLYSVEKFLIARRLMYWQVYLHKTVIGAEQLLIKILQRAKYLTAAGYELFSTPAFHWFLSQQINKSNFLDNPLHLDWFTRLDDTDIMSAIKTWECHEDHILSTMCQRVMKRDLYRSVLSNKPFSPEYIDLVKAKVQSEIGVAMEDIHYYVFTQEIQNRAYNSSQDQIKILLKSGELVDITEASDLGNLEALSKNVAKYALCYPKEVRYVAIPSTK
ncbi:MULTISPECIES: HD domain-containing protein [unclassified Sphingobacterium]|uniref:HD domain-containing protein n=1 Tax=unclassified Sphingobacterium TaxID=2609468 RepID=UPI0025F8044A|nr:MULTISPECIES: HD domain-containing protein [unclassified Sphingobacterium]MDR6735800.1 HD superfamily phosphohydrolase [Sphingobacterium sp. 2149]